MILQHRRLEEPSKAFAWGVFTRFTTIWNGSQCLGVLFSSPLPRAPATGPARWTRTASGGCRRRWQGSPWLSQPLPPGGWRRSRGRRWMLPAPRARPCWQSCAAVLWRPGCRSATLRTPAMAFHTSLTRSSSFSILFVVFASLLEQNPSSSQGCGLPTALSVLPVPSQWDSGAASGAQHLSTACPAPPLIIPRTNYSGNTTLKAFCISIITFTFQT